MSERIKFFSINDLSINYYIKIVKEKLNNFDKNKRYQDIEDILELYNIRLFIENKIFLKTWEESQIIEYKNKLYDIDVILKNFFIKINDKNITEILSKLKILYSDDFWELFEKYEVFKKINKESFKKIINKKEIPILKILSHKKLVQYYEETIKEYFMNNIDKSAELLIDTFLSEKNENEKQLFIPKSLTKDDRIEILNTYVSDELKKFNYLKIILKSSSQKDLILTPFLKIKAKKAYESILKNYFDNSNSFRYNFSIEFKKNQFYGKVIEELETEDKFLFKVNYSLDWILENLDYPTLLNNFIYLFEFVDDDFLFLNVNIENNNFFSRKFEPRVKNEYKIDFGFNLTENIISKSLMSYYDILKNSSVILEKILEWFFKIYLVKEFGIEGFSINLPTENLTYLEKCKCVTGEIERVLKQFNLYTNYKKIDKEVLELMNKPLKFEEIESLKENKYIYKKDNYLINIILFFLFSEQYFLNYSKNTGKYYKNFIQMITNEKIKKSMFSNYQLENIDLLLKEKIIFEDENQNLKYNYKLIFVLKKLYNKGVLCSEYLKDFEKEIEFLNIKEILEFESTLFSKKETEYINYFFNSKFNNGQGLRNKYAHGTYSLNENEHKRDYFKFLEILILITIKLNEEFCIDSNKSNKLNVTT